ncbi:enoyl-CoA delta isomerase 1, mitochondrial-like [Bactrocera neohumeralis]|uniref:enoyl-CoA delta isomerase 1, mitochondrial-like n=1 Tax=Bactrocera neohumeralis TaxID=98809 RepID=UPI0021667F6E|nr:enoyl-CoA delta isomerase 1, mitochondrial-like [Bactrocera neohumeralis]
MDFASPPYVAGSLAHVVGFRRAEDLLLSANTLSADEACEIGLVDEVVDGHDEAIVPCLEFMEKILALPSPLPFWVVKDQARKSLLAPLCTQALRTVDTVAFFEMLQNPIVRKNLQLHITRLSERKT